MDVVKLLNELENWVDTRKMAFGGVCTNFNRDEILDIAQKIRAALPDDVKRADRLTKEKERVLTGARQTAEATLEDAQAEAERRSREAKTNAERLVREAEAAAEKTRATADTKARELLESAKARADKMLAEAQKKSEALVSENEVVRLASVQAREIVSAAEYDSKDMRRGADEYAHAVLSDLERHVSEIMGTVEKGRKKLDQRLQSSHDRRPQQSPNGVSKEELTLVQR